MRSVMAAPGMQCATRCGSVRKPHTAAGGALTTNVLTISIAIALRPCRRRREIALRIGDELLPAPRIAEIEGSSGVLGAVARGRYGDAHAADRIRLGLLHGDWLGRLHLGPGAALLDDFREDAERHLLGKARADVEPGRVLDRIERVLGDAPGRQTPAKLGESLAAGDDRDVRGPRRER